MVAIKKPRGKMVTVVCKCGCKKEFQAREADVKRGWGKYFDKSHKAIEQEKRTGANAAFQARKSQHDGSGLYDDAVDWEGNGWDAHKGSF
jgi:hypothetical protein